MGKGLNEIEEVQLIYAFNGTEKTRILREFKELVAPKSYTEIEDTGLASKKNEIVAEIEVG